jgi:hypothetical protein
LNQILDHSGPKKQRIHRNPGDTVRIVKVYAVLIIIFAICLIGKAGYSLSENKKINNSNTISNVNSVPQISLHADKDIITMDVSSSSEIEFVSYQWYRGNNTLEEIRTYNSEHQSSEVDDDENDDEDINTSDNEISAMGDIKREKGTGTNEMTLSNIGIPKGDSTIYVVVKTVQNAIATEFVQDYHTDVGVDKLEPKIKVILQGKKLLVTAIDETEIDYITYSVNDAQEVQINDRKDKKTIETEIELIDTSSTQVRICAVDKAKNSKVYERDYDVYAGKPKIDFALTSDYRNICVTITYARGLTRVKYDLNGEEHEESFDDPEQAREVYFEVPTIQGYNKIKVWAYTEQEQVWNEDEGECDVQW